MRIDVLQVGYGDEEPMPERVSRVSEQVLASAGADLVILPELWAAGGFAYQEWAQRSEVLPQDLTEAEPGGFVEAMSRAARTAGVMLHAGSFVERAAPHADAGESGRGLWNTSLLFGPDGALLASYRKIHRFGFGQGEPVLMEAGGEVVTLDARTPSGEQTTLGLATCYDLRFPELFRAQVNRGVKLVLITAAWPQARVEAWRLLGRARAMENQMIVVQCNTAGTHSGVTMGGYSQIVDATGAVLLEAGPDPQTMSIELDLAAVDTWREQFPVLRDRRL